MQQKGMLYRHSIEREVDLIAQVQQRLAQSMEAIEHNVKEMGNAIEVHAVSTQQ